MEGKTQQKVCQMFICAVTTLNSDPELKVLMN